MYWLCSRICQQRRETPGNLPCDWLWENGIPLYARFEPTDKPKQVIFTNLISRIPAPTPIAKQTLIVAHRRELVQQAFSHCQATYPNLDIDMEIQASHASGLADITVASIRSLMSSDRLEKFDPERYKLILVDEAHHIVAPQYLQLLEHFGLRHREEQAIRDESVHNEKHGGPVLVGVSATFARFDGIKLGSAIDHIVYHRDYVDMIRTGWLSNVRFTTVKWHHADLSAVELNQAGDFATNSLSKAINTPENNEAVFSAWQDRCSDRSSTIVFCVDIAHVERLLAMFRRYGISAEAVTSNTKPQPRSETVEKFKKGQTKVLLNCGVFTEGTDIPNIDCVILARPTKSRNLLVQMIGRGMRLSPGKSDCHVLDMVSALRTGVVTTPTLLGLDPDELVENATIQDLERLVKSKEKEARHPGNTLDDHNFDSGRDISFQYTDYDTVNDLVSDTRELRHIRALSRFAWVNISRPPSSKFGDHCLSGGESQGRIRIMEQQANAVSDTPTFSYEILYNAALPPQFKKGMMLRKPKSIAQLPTFDEAVRTADTFAKARFPLNGIDLQAAWRNKAPSEGQIAFLRKRYSVGDEGGFELDEENLTRGQAADLIVRAVYGGKGLLKRQAKAEERREKKEEKELERREREFVRQGPLDA
jgi:ATP-dependent helicase IRC3